MGAIHSNHIEVMIIEDDELAANIYAEFIGKLDNFKVTYIANTGEQAKNVLDQYKPQLILLDIYLPDTHGIELLWHIRKLYRTTDIILITASNEAETVREAIRGGAFSYIIKPVMMNKFLDTLKHYEHTTKTLNQTELIKQSDVDSLFYSRENKRTPLKMENQTDLPKGIDKFTLTRIKDQLSSTTTSFNANEFSQSLKMSHSTARRYLEYLASEGVVEISIQHGTVGRPERKYTYRRNKE
ncbi:response regulator [Alkalihalophilus lindianensis]|uniref:Response regulator n=1 Tax=Alkalihalophilus lindianensis TaxID=1630542 RepID=A0ABU3XE09_9BACI|nr:response regulator [Alkalihalophilus lindianensis]MDV2686119.1 response regulator [Alkalihalophilus lindianensis]